jgi:methyl-accepting chemotaxis protein
MKTFRLANLSLVVKMAMAPTFAVIMLALVAGGAFWAQAQQTRLLQQVVNEDMAVSSRLLQASKHISAVHGSLYQLMTRQAAGGSPADSETKLKSLMAEINGIKVELTAIKARLPADQQAKFGGVLKDLGTYHDGVEVVGSMLGIDFNSAASFVEPFEAQYASMTTALDRTSHDVISASSERAKASAARAALYGKALMALVLLTIAAVAAVAFATVMGVRKAVADISGATESLAQGDETIDLEALARGDELGAIVQSLSVFRDNQRRIVVLRAEQEDSTTREAAARTAQERDRAAGEAEQQQVVQGLADGLARLASGDLAFRIGQAFPPNYESCGPTSTSPSASWPRRWRPSTRSPTTSTAGRGRSRPPRKTCRAAPSTRPRAWKRRRRPWTRSRPRFARWPRALRTPRPWSPPRAATPKAPARWR